MAHPYDLWNGNAAADFRQKELAGRIPDPPWEWRVWRFRFDVRDIVTPAAATSQALGLTLSADVAAPRPFPTYVFMEHAHLVLVEDFAGGSASDVDLSLGDAGDGDGLLTSSSVFTGVAPEILRTPAAAQYGLRTETGFLPQLTIDVTGDNVDALTAGIVDVLIPFAPIYPSLEHQV